MSSLKQKLSASESRVSSLLDEKSRLASEAALEAQDLRRTADNLREELARAAEDRDEARSEMIANFLIGLILAT